MRFGSGRPPKVDHIEAAVEFTRDTISCARGRRSKRR